MNFVLDWLIPVLLVIAFLALILGGVQCTMQFHGQPTVETPRPQPTEQELEQQRQDMLDIAIYSTPMTMFTCPMP